MRGSSQLVGCVGQRAAKCLLASSCPKVSIVPPQAGAELCRPHRGKGKESASLGQRAGAVDVCKVQAQGALVAWVGHFQHPVEATGGLQNGQDQLGEHCGLAWQMGGDAGGMCSSAGK